MENTIGDRIAESRLKLGLTQDQFGARYGVTGPAVFKFEKGYVKPSLELWLKMSKDCGIAEKKAVLLWVRSKLPREYQAFIELSSPGASETPTASQPRDKSDYSRVGDARDLRQQLLADNNLPAGMRVLFQDDEFWALYHPTGEEVQMMIDKFGSYSDAKESLFRDAIRLIRGFVRSDF